MLRADEAYATVMKNVILVTRLMSIVLPLEVEPSVGVVFDPA